MSENDGFYFPGILGSLEDGTPIGFHEAGIDNPAVYLDPPDIFGLDPDLDVDTARMQAREHIPQTDGPNYLAGLADEPSAIDEKLDRLRKEFMERWSFEPVTVVIVGSMQTTAAGGVDQTSVGNCELYTPPPGWTLGLHRLTIRNGGNNFGTPFNAAGAYYEIRVNNEPIDGDSLVAAAGQFSKGLPAVRLWGTRDAPRIRDGQVLSLFMASGPTSQTITINGQGTLVREAEG